MLWAPYLHGHVLERKKKPLQSPSTTLLSLPPSRKALLTFHTGAGFHPLEAATFPGWPLHPGLASVYPVYPQLFSSLPPWHNCHFFPWSPLASWKLCPLPLSPHNMPTFPWWMPAQLSEQLYQEALSALSRGGDALDRVSCCLATSFSLFQQRFSLPVLLMQAQQMTAILLKQSLHRFIYGYCCERICKHFFTSFLSQSR